ncbi:KAT8 regulatory NSL complex subunit 1-like [Protopterus annectens]|uniref:KAT8 regulatory NSL complex subunit 1-like n=1 Tax=Protopterus annectens TaxID=7888 RepID=UPI001CF9B4FF|nr:KAT8 regulatory NSL complex subunit 1-like [Protopterus annectens]
MHMAEMPPSRTEAAHRCLKLAVSSSLAPSNVNEDETLLLSLNPHLKDDHVQNVKGKDSCCNSYQCGVLLSLPQAWFNREQLKIQRLVSRLKKTNSASVSKLPNGLMDVCVNENSRALFSPSGLMTAISADTACTKGECSSVSKLPTNQNKFSCTASFTLSKMPLLCSQPQADITGRAAVLLNQHAELESRVQRLCQRLQTVQTKQVDCHVQQQLRGFLGHSLERTQQLHFPHSRTLCYSKVASMPLSSSSGAALTSFLSEPEVSSDISRLVQSTTVALQGLERTLDSDCTESSSGGETESEEELYNRNNLPLNDRLRQQYKLLQSEAEWRWIMERAAVISRWTWLQAQVSDLEYRIQKQTDIYRQICYSKTPVLLDDVPQPEDLMKQQYQVASATPSGNSERNRLASSCKLKIPLIESKCGLSPCSPSHVLRNVDKQSSRLTQSLGNFMCPSSPLSAFSRCSSLLSKPCTPPRNAVSTLNSLQHVNPDSCSLDSTEFEESLNKKQMLIAPSSPPDNSCIAARVRPVYRYRKRKLLRSNIVLWPSKKKPLNMRCSCELPSKCILCDCKATSLSLDPNLVPLQERIAQLEPSFHSILSFPNEHPVHLHLSILLKEDMLHRLLQKANTHNLSNLKKKPKDFKNTCQRWASSLISSPSSALKSNTHQPAVTNHNPLEPGSQISRLSSMVNQLSSFSVSCSSSCTSMESCLTVTAGHSSSASAVSSSVRKRRGECSFDINNIVIPFSVAASARVEKLQYKTIITPSWRIVDPAVWETRSNFLKMQIEDEEFEDCSDEAYLNRHSAYEDSERSRWNYWVLSNLKRRGSRSYKVDGHSATQSFHVNPSATRSAFSDYEFHTVNDSNSSSSSGPHSPELFTPQQIFTVQNHTRIIYFSENTQSPAPEIADDEMKVRFVLTVLFLFIQIYCSTSKIQIKGTVSAATFNKSSI